jgi:hypothetical protein
VSASEQEACRPCSPPGRLSLSLWSRWPSTNTKVASEESGRRFRRPHADPITVGPTADHPATEEALRALLAPYHSICCPSAHWEVDRVTCWAPRPGSALSASEQEAGKARRMTSRACPSGPSCSSRTRSWPQRPLAVDSAGCVRIQSLQGPQLRSRQRVLSGQQLIIQPQKKRSERSWRHTNRPAVPQRFGRACE